MNKTKYHIRHIRCNMQDFRADRHRFYFEYNGKTEMVSCYGSVDCHFENTELPEAVKEEILGIIFAKMDRKEKSWRYPAEAYSIANAYCN